MISLRTRQHPAVGIRLDDGVRRACLANLDNMETLFRVIERGEGDIPLDYIDWSKILDQIDLVTRALRDGLEEVPE